MTNRVFQRGGGEQVARRGHWWSCWSCGHGYLVESGDIQVVCLLRIGFRWRSFLTCPACGERDFRLVYEADGTTVVAAAWLLPAT